MNDEMIDVADINPAELLASLYNGAAVMGMGILQQRPGAMTVDEAQKLIDGSEVESDYAGAEQTRQKRANGGRVYFDYLHGKPLKLEINGKTLRPWGYDRDHGRGAAQRIVDGLRKRSSAHSPQVKP